MKLQINQSGAWRNVAEYPIDDDGRVRAAAVELALTVGHASLRIVDHPSGEVVAAWNARGGWVEYPFRKAA